jgi:hypothetical protein
MFHHGLLGLELRAEFLHAVRARYSDDDCDAAGLHVLLKREIPIDDQQFFEAFRKHELQKFPVALGRPTHVYDMMDVVPDQIAQ